MYFSFVYLLAHFHTYTLHRLSKNVVTGEQEEFWGEVMDYDSEDEKFYIEYKESTVCTPEWLTVADVVNSLRDNLDNRDSDEDGNKKKKIKRKSGRN